PEGAEPVDNAVGTAPGVFLLDGTHALLALPGVPAEMRAVFDAALPRLRACLGAPAHVVEREVASGSGDESVITVAVERVMGAVPGVHLKSLATAFATDCALPVRITARAATRAEEREVRPGELVCAPAGEEHAVRNPGPEQLALLVVMAPKPS